MVCGIQQKWSIMRVQIFYLLQHVTFFLHEFPRLLKIGYARFGVFLPPVALAIPARNANRAVSRDLGRQRTGRRFARGIGAAFGVACLGLACTAHAIPIKQYDYTGNQFNLANGALTTNDRVTGVFSLDCGAISPGGDCTNLPFNDYSSALVSLSLAAGPFALSLADPQVNLGAFSIMTDASMSITAWDVRLITSNLGGDIRTTTLSPVIDIAAFCSTCPVLGTGVTNAAPGSWSLSSGPPAPTSIYEPETVAMFGVGLVGLAFAARRGRRKGPRADGDAGKPREVAATDWHR